MTLEQRLSELGAERSRYLLDSLAQHLAAANARDRLRQLFIDDQWMRARHAADDARYDGFVSDLSLAWDTCRGQIGSIDNSDHGDTALTDCVRYALIWTTINSLSRDAPPELLARAVELGVVSPQQALSRARAGPRVRRVEYLTLLLSTQALNASQRAAAQRDALALVGAVDVKRRADALVALVPHLESIHAQDALEIAASLPGRERAPALAAVAPLLEPEQRRSTALQALSAIDSTYHYVTSPYGLDGVWAMTVAVLDDADLSDALERASTCGPEERGHAFVALAQRFAEPKSSQLQRDAIDAFHTLGEHGAVYALAKSLPRLSEDVRRDAVSWLLETALRIEVAYYLPDTDHSQIKGLTAAAPYLAEDDLARAIEKALAIPVFAAYKLGWVTLMTALAQRARGEAAEELRRTVLAQTAEPDDPVHTGGQLPSVLIVDPLLDDDERTIARRAALENVLSLAPAQSASSDNERADSSPRQRGLAAIAPHLDELLIRQALLSDGQIGDQDTLAVSLVALSTHLSPETRLATADVALNVLAGVRDGELRCAALKMVAADVPDELLCRAWDLTDGLNDSWSYVRAIEPLCLRLEPSLADWALDKVARLAPGPSRADLLVALAPIVPARLLDHAAGLARSWAADSYWAPTDYAPNVWFRAEALAALAAQHSGTRRDELLDEVLQMYLDYPRDDDAPKVLVALAAHATGALAGTVLEHARRQRCNELDDILISLSPRLDLGQLSRAVEAVGAVQDFRDDVCAALAPHLNREQLARLLTVAVGGIRDFSAAQCLAALAPFLPTSMLDQSLDIVDDMQPRRTRHRRWLRTAPRWPDGGWADRNQRTALVGLAPYLDERQSRRAFAIASGIDDVDHRVAAIAAVLPQLRGRDAFAAVTDIIDSSTSTDDIDTRARAVLAAWPNLPDAQRLRLLHRLLPDGELRFADSIYRAGSKSPLLELVSVLDASTLRVWLHQLMTMADPGRRMFAFKHIHLPTDPRAVTAVREAIAVYLLFARDWQRSEILRWLTLPVLREPFVSTTELETITRATIDVCSTWRWQ